TSEICAAAAREDARIRYTRQPQNIGPVANFAYVRELARGEFLMFAAHDDLRTADFVEECLTALRANDKAVLAHSYTQFIGPEDERRELIEFDEGLQSLDFLTRLKAFVSARIATTIYGVFRSASLRELPPLGPH